MRDVHAQERSIFLHAVELESPADVAAYLDEACRGDGELRQRVEALLTANRQHGDVFDCSQPAATAAWQEITERSGTQIGPYKLREMIGEGGFGVVYVAEQERPVQRKVALKIIKPGMDTREVIARFEAERQALALMDHPNIARVLDAGTTEESNRHAPRAAAERRPANDAEAHPVDRDHPAAANGTRSVPATLGRPYFVMELVRGVPITEFCDEQKLTTRERLQLFVDVCRAVQHAHQKGIIHRDLKPSNVMVTLHDDKPVVKVIDFGVSKALASKLTEKTVYTAYGQMVGTPLYMSPEQAQLSGLDVDTRSDVYSLGVLLYALLTGTTPFDKETLQKSGFDEMRRIIREVDPPRPSARISTLRAEMLSTVSDKRKIDPRKLGASLRGELDWIVMKALEKDRNRRYESASAFAADVERYLADEPVQACPPSVWYRFRKFARRRKSILVTTALVMASLLCGLGLSLWQAVRATNEARRANEAEELAGRRLKQVDEQRQLVQQNLEQTERQRQRAEGNVRVAFDALDKVYLPLAEAEYSENPELSEQDREFLEKTLPFYEKLAAQKADDRQARLSRAQAYLRVGNIYRTLRTELDDKNKKAERALQRGITLFEDLVDQHPNESEYQRQLAVSYLDLGELLYTNQPNAAERAYRRAIALYEKVVDRLPWRQRNELVRIYNVLGRRLNDPWGRSQEALVVFQKSLDFAEQLLQRYPDEPIHHSRVADSLKAIADVHRSGNRHKQAEDYLRRAIAHLENAIGKFPSSYLLRYRYGTVLASFAGLFGETRRRDEARKTYIRARDVLENVVRRSPRNSPARSALGSEVLPALAGGFEAGKQYFEAEYAWRRAIELTGQLAIELPGGVWPLRWSEHRLKLASFLRRRGRRKEANRIRRDVVAGLDDLNPTTAGAYYQRGLLYLEVAGYYKKALADFDKSLQLEPTRHYYRYKRRALTHFYLKNYQHALADLGKSIELNPNDDHNLWWIRHQEVAQSGDKAFREGMVKLADRVIEKHGKSKFRFLRARLLAAIGQYERALDDFRIAIKQSLFADPERYQLALASLANSDHSTYRATCREMMKRPHPLIGIWTCSLAPNALDDYSRAVKVAREAIKRFGQYEWAQQNLGAILYRAGRFKEAIKPLTAALKAKRVKMAPLATLTKSTYVHYLLAMTYHRLGQREDAQKHLMEANRQTRRMRRPEWNLWQTVELLRREAEAMIRPSNQSRRQPVVAPKPEHN